MPKIILDAPDQYIGDALNSYYQNLRQIERLKIKERLKVNHKGEFFIITKNRGSTLVKMRT